MSAASVKSLLSVLYGIGEGQGRIDLRLTLAELGIDEAPPGLTAIERRATIRDLLMARSGVHHPAADEAPIMKATRPARGSHAPRVKAMNQFGMMLARIVAAMPAS